MVYRIDRGNLSKPIKMSNGWLRIDGRITRTGVFTYREPNGKMRRELRLPEEVFKTDAMQSFALVPVTDEHPPGFLDATNTRDYARGSVAGTLRKDGEFIAGEILVTDASLVAKLERGDARELSCGYNCDLDEQPGVTSDGLRYDAIQRNIRGNHVAVVPKGRAGPEARVRMDGASVEVLDGDDDQPRDENGQWSSTGGGGSAKAAGPVATLKTPDSENRWVQDPKTGKWKDTQPKQPRAPKGAVTELNKYTLFEHMSGSDSATNQVSPTSRNGITRALKAGLVKVEGKQLVLTDAGRKERDEYDKKEAPKEHEYAKREYENAMVMHDRILERGDPKQTDASTRNIAAKGARYERAKLRLAAMETRAKNEPGAWLKGLKKPPGTMNGY